MRHLLRNIVLPFVLFGLVTFHALPSQAQELTTEEIVRLKALLAHIRVVEGDLGGLQGPHILYEGVNVHLRSGSGSTDDGGRLTGLGNFVVGYNEDPVIGALQPGDRGGSHNIMGGRGHRIRSFGGFVVGSENTLDGEMASVSGGQHNTGSAWAASVSGGESNTASDQTASVSGGFQNSATGWAASISGGEDNVASGTNSSVSAGFRNTASGEGSSVTGGRDNRARAIRASVTGGRGNIAEGGASSILGGMDNVTRGSHASISGGDGNIANGRSSSISGGLNRTASEEHNWAAGNLFEAF